MKNGFSWTFRNVHILVLLAEVTSQVETTTTQVITNSEMSISHNVRYGVLRYFEDILILTYEYFL